MAEEDRWLAQVARELGLVEDRGHHVVDGGGGSGGGAGARGISRLDVTTDVSDASAATHRVERSRSTGAASTINRPSCPPS